MATNKVNSKYETDSNMFDWFVPEEKDPKETLAEKIKNAKETEYPIEIPQRVNEEISDNLLDESLVSQMEAPSLAQSLTRSPRSYIGAPSVSGVERAQDALNTALSFQAAGTGEKTLAQREQYKKRLEDDPANKKIAADLSNQLVGIGQKRQEAKKFAQDRETQAAWLEALDRISQGLVQYAAAKYGMEKGVNLAGLQKVDFSHWKDMKDRAYQNLKDELLGLEKMEDRVFIDKKQHAADIGKQIDLALGSQQDAERQERAGKIAMAQSGVELEKYKVDKAAQAAAQENARQRAEEEMDLKLRALDIKENQGDTKAELDKLKLSQGTPAQVNQLKSQILKEYITEEKAADQKINETYKLLGSLDSFKDIKDKAAKDKLKVQIAQGLAAAGMSDADVKSEKGLFWKTLELDPEKAKSQLQTYVATLKNQKLMLNEQQKNLIPLTSLAEIKQTFIENATQSFQAPASRSWNPQEHSAEENAAYEWMQKNPQDPRVPGIKKKLGL